MAGGARDCPYTYMQDLVAGRYRLPWENEVRVTDGTSCGFRPPTRHLPERQAKADETLRQADPYPWPYNGDLRPANTALIVIDMQTDFCGVGGYVDKMGYDLSLTRAPIEPITRCSRRCARKGYTIIHTREGHRPDLSDLPANKRWRSRQIGAGIGDPGPCGRILVRGEPGWEIIPDLAPRAGEIVIDKPGKGSFYATDLELILRTARHREHRSDRHHHRCLRPHDDARGQRSRLRVPAAGGLLRRHRPRQSRAAIKMIKMQGGVFGAVSS